MEAKWAMRRSSGALLCGPPPCSVPRCRQGRRAWHTNGGRGCERMGSLVGSSSPFYQPRWGVDLSGPWHSPGCSLYATSDGLARARGGRRAPPEHAWPWRKRTAAYRITEEGGQEAANRGRRAGVGKGTTDNPTATEAGPLGHPGISEPQAQGAASACVTEALVGVGLACRVLDPPEPGALVGPSLGPPLGACEVVTPVPGA